MSTLRNPYLDEADAVGGMQQPEERILRRLLKGDQLSMMRHDVEELDHWACSWNWRNGDSWDEEYPMLVMTLIARGAIRTQLYGRVEVVVILTDAGLRAARRLT